MPAIWNDRNGKFSLLRAVTLALLAGPGLYTLMQVWTGQFPARPVTEVIHATGLWTIRLIMVTLAVTPFRQAWEWPRLIFVRRMIGVAAFCYAATHLFFYIVDLHFDLAKVFSEIWLRIYLTIGFVAVLLLAVLASTSTDKMIKRLGGKKWQLLHRAIYLIAVLAVIHYYMQSKADVWEPTIVAGMLIWLMIYRVLFWTKGKSFAASRWQLAALGVGAAVLTALGEALYYKLATTIDPMRVLKANWTFANGLRPGWVLLIAGGIVLAIAVGRSFMPKPTRARPAAHPARP